MTEHRAWFRRPGCLLALAAPVVVVALVLAFIGYELRAIYTSEVLVVLPSPTGAWTARVVEYTVEGPLSTSIGAEVELVSRERPHDATDLLGVDTGGHNEERPRIAWSAPSVLRVTVPNISYLKVLTRNVDGVQVDIQFDPDDPAARAAWLKKLDSPSD